MTYAQNALLDIHARCHLSMQRFITHCGGLSAEQLDTSLDGFGSSTVREQLHHVIGAERYWLSVLLGAMDASEDPADAVSIEALEALRVSVSAATARYLRDASGAELNTRRPMTTWGGNVVELVPAHVILRTQTHLFHHMGQIAAMCRLLGHPVEPGMDFSLR